MKEILINVLMITGCFLQFVSCLGIFKYPSFMLRLQVATKGATLGAGLNLLALTLYFWDGEVSFKVLLVAAFLFLTSPTVSHLFGITFQDKLIKKK